MHQPFRFLQNSGYCPQNQNKGSRSGKKRAALFSTGCPAQKNVLARGFFMQCFFNSDVAVHLGDGISDPKFETDANLNKIEKWNDLWENIGKEVELADDNSESQYQLLKWLDFWSPGNHDDRTIAILY